MSLTEAQVFETLEKVGAIVRNSHIVYTSGNHGDAYINKDAVYPHTQIISLLCWELSEKFRESDVDIVLAPALGGIILSQWIAHHLTEMCQREILAIYAEKDIAGDGFVIKRGYDKLLKGKNLLVVEDVLTTGGSVRKVVDTAKAAGGNILAVAALCNRGGIQADQLGAPELQSLINLNLQTWEAKDCPLCRQNVPINTSVGKGREFLKGKSSN